MDSMTKSSPTLNSAISLKSNTSPKSMVLTILPELSKPSMPIRVLSYPTTLGGNFKSQSQKFDPKF
jgi:hypothetical protein